MKKKLFIVVDMQNDFVTGSLGTKEAQAIVPRSKKEIESFLEVKAYNAISKCTVINMMKFTTLVWFQIFV